MAHKIGIKIGRVGTSGKWMMNGLLYKEKTYGSKLLLLNIFRINNDIKFKGCDHWWLSNCMKQWKIVIDNQR